MKLNTISAESNDKNTILLGSNVGIDIRRGTGKVEAKSFRCAVDMIQLSLHCSTDSIQKAYKRCILDTICSDEALDL
jgi:hypothetical protein